jgi:hypothetical protein
MNSDTTQELKGGLLREGLTWQRHSPACQSWWLRKCQPWVQKERILSEAHALLLRDIETPVIARNSSPVHASPIRLIRGLNVLLLVALGAILTMWWSCRVSVGSQSKSSTGFFV